MKILVRDVAKLFGHVSPAAVHMLRNGEPKAAILEKTGCQVGLAGVSFTVEAGQVFVIMGLSGSGKSTLVRHLNRLVDPTLGQIEVDGIDVMSLDEKGLRLLRRRKVSMVFQNFGLLPHKTILENIAYGLWARGERREEAHRKAYHWLERIGLQGYEKIYPDELSGGMQQRVGLARALAMDTDIVLMDEAFSALDPVIRAEMQDQLLALQKSLNKTIVFITHDPSEAMRLGDRIAVLRDGLLVQQGSAEELRRSPVDEYVRHFVEPPISE